MSRIGNARVAFAEETARLDYLVRSMIAGGRLTLESGVPVSSADQTAKTNIYYTPYVHDIVPLWNGTRWIPTAFAEYTLALGTLTSAKPYDIFAYISSGALALEVLVWTNGTTRATGVSVQDGRYCKTGDKTRLYLGSFYTTATTTTEDSVVRRYLWNAYNRRPRQVFRYNGSGHTYTAAVWRAWNNDAPNSQIEFLVGLAEDTASLGAYHNGANTGANVAMNIGAAFDLTNTSHTHPYSMVSQAPNVVIASASLAVSQYSGVGYHFFCAVQYSAVSGTTTWGEVSVFGQVMA